MPAKKQTNNCVYLLMKKEKQLFVVSDMFNKVYR